MKTLKLLSAAATIAILAGGLSSQSQAATQDVDASITTRSALSITKNSDMDFGQVDYTGAHSGTITLGTDGSIAATGTGLTTSGGSPTAGDLSVTGDGASLINITCETSGILEAAGGDQLTLQNTEISVNTGGAGTTFGLGTACAGIGSGAVAADLSANPTTEVLIGGEIDATGVGAIAESGAYSTTTGGGNPVTVDVVYQ